MKFLLAQIQTTCGDLKNNLNKITAICTAHDSSDTLIIFPELALTGYPLEDLVESSEFLNNSSKALKQLIQITQSINSSIIITHPHITKGKIFNCLYIIQRGKIFSKIYKTSLPNYSVFDEKRNFHSGKNNRIIELNGKKIGFLICEDMWSDTLSLKLKNQGAEILISVNASPFDLEKAEKRITIAQGIVRQTNLPFIYLNLYGAQDELVFDGGSFAINSSGAYVLKPKYWEDNIFHVDIEGHIDNENDINFSKLEHTYNALILGLRNYIINNGFKKALVAISGGIDSALVTTLVADAIGSDNIVLVRLPSEYSSEHSLTDALELAKNVNVKPITISIDEIVSLINTNVSPHLINPQNFNVTEENLQARARGIIMMALSNNLEAILLSTGNKSEYACGYATIYGDMCGGFAPIKDIYKTDIYALCNYRNNNIPSLSSFKKLHIIPANTISKPPSAELRPNQLDSDTLPPYEVLDLILYQIIEKNSDLKSLIKLGFDKNTVKKVIKLIKSAEYKRRQSPIGTKISIKNFGKDRRYPITNLYESK